MEINTSVLALILSSLSLVMSLYTSVTTRRANQLQKLAGIRTKLSNISLKISFEISEYERYASKLDQLPTDSRTTWTEDISYIKSKVQEIEEVKSQLDKAASTLSKFPISLRIGQIDEIEHRVDSISEIFNLAYEKLLPRMAKLAEHDNNV